MYVKYSNHRLRKTRHQQLCYMAEVFVVSEGDAITMEILERTLQIMNQEKYY